MAKRWPGFLLIAAILLLWEYASAQRWVDPVSMPRVSAIAVSWLRNIEGGALLQSLGPTLARIGTGFGLAALVAVPLGLLMGSVPFIYRLFEPITEFVRPIPSSAYIPVAILFLGIDNEMKIFVVFLACLFPILLNTYSGVRGVDFCVDRHRANARRLVGARAVVDYPSGVDAEHLDRHARQPRYFVDCRRRRRDDRRQQRHRLFYSRHAAHFPGARDVRRDFHAWRARLLHQFRFFEARRSSAAMARNQR